MNQKDFFPKYYLKKIKYIDFKKSTIAEKSFTTRRPFFYSSNAQKKCLPHLKWRKFFSSIELAMGTKKNVVFRYYKKCK
jgi:hypothetical protein